MLVFVIGPSASGKTTQAVRLAEKLDAVHVSTGQLLRDEVERNTELGRKIAPVIDRGDFAPFDWVITLLEAKIYETFRQGRGLVIDGFPREYIEAVDMQPLIDQYEDWTRIIHYLLSYEDCLARQRARTASGEKRNDDNALYERYQQYHEEIDQIRAFYKERGLLIEIDAKPSIDEIFTYTWDALQESLRYEKKHY